ncbi:MAG TPA: hypothetical protein VJA18_04325 [Candidatus Nanoarchaeia archaeon]|nr:hypothetical protein [Candidatus Nanoarchaeia archaeon]
MLQVILGLQMLTQADYCSRGTPYTKQRTVFEREFDFSIQGFPKDVEENEGKVSRIANVVQKEKLEKPFDITAIRISSENYLEKSWFGQLEHIVVSGGEAYSGINYPFVGRIYINNDSVYSSTIHHEIKHAKTDELFFSNPEFEERWLVLTVDEQGESLYLGYTGWVLPKVRGVGKLFPRKEIANYEKSGFVSPYAALGFYEDVAETCEEAEAPSDKFAKWLYAEKNETIIAKVSLAQEYGLIPAEFSEYITLRKSFKEKDLLEEKIEVKKEELDDKVGVLLEESAAFLAQHPDSVYEINLRKRRGRLLEKEENYEDAIREYKLGLIAKFKDHDDYPDLLSDIADCHKKVGNAEKVSLYLRAKEKYDQGWKANDVHIAVHGVNDFLRENGGF